MVVCLCVNSPVVSVSHNTWYTGQVDLFYTPPFLIVPHHCYISCPLTSPQVHAALMRRCRVARRRRLLSRAFEGWYSGVRESRTGRWLEERADRWAWERERKKAMKRVFLAWKDVTMFLEWDSAVLRYSVVTFGWVLVYCITDACLSVLLGYEAFLWAGMQRECIVFVINMITVVVISHTCHHSSPLPPSFLTSPAGMDSDGRITWP